MNDDLAAFRALMERAAAGCPNARRDLYDQYAWQVRGAVRRRLHPRMRSVFDSRDFTQDVWASFFTLAPGDRTFAGPDDFVVFLQTVAKHKVVEAFRRRMGGARENLNQAQHLSHGAAGPGREPTPSQVAVADEGWAAMVAGQPSLVRQILVLLREGHTYEEVGHRTGLHPKAIQRRVQRLMKRVKP